MKLGKSVIHTFIFFKYDYSDLSVLRPFKMWREHFLKCHPGSYIQYIWLMIRVAIFLCFFLWFLVGKAM